MFSQKTRAPARNADPNTTAFLGWKWDKFQPGCCEADFGSRIKILGYPLGRSASFFEIYLFRLVPAPEIDFFQNPIAEMAGAARGVNPPSLRVGCCREGGNPPPGSKP